MLRVLAPPLGLLAILLSQVAPVATTNFWGYDEWLIQHLLSMGIIDVPYANRPLGFLWLLPIPHLTPHDLRGWTVLYVGYGLASALLVYALCRRLAPDRPLLAFATAALFLAWAPSDLARLACFERTEYMSITFAMLLALLGFSEAWIRRNEALLAVAILVAFATVRSYEATLPLLSTAPFLLAVVTRDRSPLYWRWAAAWGAFGVLAALLVAMPVLVPAERSYQQALGLDVHAGRILWRIANQYFQHLWPLFHVSARDLMAPAVPAAAGSFLAGSWLIARGSRLPERAVQRRHDLVGMLLGLGWAGLGYALFSFNRETGAWRKEFFAAPGIALFLACAASLVVSWAPERFRPPATAALIAAVIAVGTSGALAMQRFWDRLPFYQRQTSFLTELVRDVPDVRPHTLFVLLDETGTWRSAWGFRHAAQYLYGGRASGWAYGTATLMYPSAFTVAGVVCVPWPEVQQAWRQPPTLHRYDELVVLRRRRGGRVEVAADWPSELPALPPGARYAPASRVVTAPVGIPARAILLGAPSGAPGLSGRPPDGSPGAVTGGH